MSNIELTQMYIFPVKSLPGIRVEQAVLTPQGLKGDRRWMLVNNMGNFITQRLYPQLALLKVELSEGSIHITLPDSNMITLQQQPPSGAEITVRIWKDDVTAIMTDDVSNQLISQFLGVSCQFVYLPDETVRPIDPDFSISHTDQVSFADGFQFLLISEASLQDLNQRLLARNISSVPMIRFRPNIVVAGCDAYAEDLWKGFKIGGATFSVVKPCSRCVMTTVNPETGQKGKEPLATLLEYRKTGNRAYFGQNVLADRAQSGKTLSIGDKVQLI